MNPDPLDATERLRTVLVLHPGAEFTPAPLAAGWDIAARWDTSVAEVEAALRLPEAANLVTLLDTGRYRLAEELRADVDDIHDHGPDHPEHRKAQRRMVQWYLDKTAAADLILNPLQHRISPVYDTVDPHTFADTTEARAWVDREFANIVAAQQRAVRNGWDPEVIAFAETLWNPLRITYRDELAETQRLGADAAARSGHALEPFCRARQAYAESTRGRHAIARSLATMAINRATALHHQRALGVALGVRSRAFRKAGDLRRAQRDQQRALEIDVERGSVRGQALCHRNLGELALASEPACADPYLALEHFACAARLFREVGDEVGHARTMIGYARALAHVASYKAALDALNDIEDVLRSYGALGYLADLDAARAEIHVLRGQDDAAHGYYCAAAAHLADAGPGAATAVQAITTLRDDLAASP